MGEVRVFFYREFKLCANVLGETSVKFLLRLAVALLLCLFPFVNREPARPYSE